MGLEENLYPRKDIFPVYKKLVERDQEKFYDQHFRTRLLIDRVEVESD